MLVPSPAVMEEHRRAYHIKRPCAYILETTCIWNDEDFFTCLEYKPTRTTLIDVVVKVGGKSVVKVGGKSVLVRTLWSAPSCARLVFVFLRSVPCAFYMRLQLSRLMKSLPSPLSLSCVGHCGF